MAEPAPTEIKQSNSEPSKTTPRNAETNLMTEKDAGSSDNKSPSPDKTQNNTQEKASIQQKESESNEESDDEDGPTRKKDRQTAASESEMDSVLAEEKECLLLLLEARVLLQSLIKWKEADIAGMWQEQLQKDEEEKKRTGNMSVTEIQRLLQANPEDDSEDLLSKLQELKQQLALEVRRNHVLGNDLAKLDKRIALLIKSRDPNFIRDSLNIKLKSQKKPSGPHPTSNNQISIKQLEYYQDLFYLLQTEPRYLARLLYLMNQDQMENFLDTTILTLFGEAYSPREEFLILSLFQKAIETELSVLKNVGEFLTAESVVPKMVVTYNRRKLGLEYLKQTLSPILNKFLAKEDMNLELGALGIYQNMINDIEIRTGEKCPLDRNITEEEAAKNPDVDAILQKRLTDLEDVCQLVLDGIISSLNHLPYGLRWICKTIREMCKKKFPDCNLEELLRLQGFFLYFRFINPALVTPDAFQLVNRDLSTVDRKNLVIVAKVLQYLFNLKTFSVAEKNLQTLNGFIHEKQEVIIEYFNAVVQVANPEEELEVDKYLELTQKAKPIILISPHEIVSTHKSLLVHLNEIAPDKDDPLRLVLTDLGEPSSDIGPDDDRELQLTLNNRFKVDMEQESEVSRLYAETKEFVIPILRMVPLVQSVVRLNLMDILEAGIKFAADTNNKQLSNQINRVLENIQKLEEEGKMTKNDNYDSFVLDVALEVANRRAIREQQRKEIARLSASLEKLQKHSLYINEQITDYTKYLRDCLNQHYNPNKKGKVKKPLGPFKFTYKELAKKGVIIDSDVPQLSQKGTIFVISSEDVGVFDIEAKIAGISVEKMKIELDDLLEKHYSHIERLELDQVVLDVNMTLHLINTKFKLLK
eukprot:TRINITY_DN585_c0_g1_i1.p1 TRINITY_DN585_c0_g1~~TRINITY_DN585_c0_g1_i1.p1  ORF type:complete len:871 (+),score=226.12 TRINITY_DN585_c0_g1_i1:44-2656(+)